MEQVRDYRDLKVWQMAMDLAPRAYDVVRKLPRTETYALGDQLRRAVVSIAANIAEGRGRQHTREFLQHVCMARGSLAELETLLLLAERLGFAFPGQLQSLHRDADDLWRALHALTAALSRRLQAA